MVSPALLATVAGSLTAGALLLAAGCALYGAWHLAHDYQAWADNQRHQRAWRESTEIVTGGPLLLADDEPDLHDDRCGTDQDALNTLRDMWKRSPGGDQ